MNRTGILQVISRKLAPFVILFGFYLVSFGHLTPGGGFQGGVVIASGVILLLLGQPMEQLGGLVNIRLFGLAETLSLVVFLGAGIAGIVLGGAFLQVLLPTGATGRVTDAGFVFILNVVIGMKVGAGITVICYRLFMET
jgi:multicomponent Na+:H+ antiporter subunit B